MKVITMNISHRLIACSFNATEPSVMSSGSLRYKGGLHNCLSTCSTTEQFFSSCNLNVRNKKASGHCSIEIYCENTCRSAIIFFVFEPVFYFLSRKRSFMGSVKTRYTKYKPMKPCADFINRFYQLFYWDENWF